MEFFDAITEFAPGESSQLQHYMERETSFFQPMLLKKHQFLVAESNVCKFFCLIRSGILQHSISVNDQEITTYIGLRNSITSSLGSFLYNKPSRKSIKAISDCELLVIGQRDFERLMASRGEFHRLYHALLERQICLIDDYRIDLLSLTPEERYTKLLKTEPLLLQDVPLHYLASFLGISDRHMSRIRKNIK